MIILFVSLELSRGSTQLAPVWLNHMQFNVRNLNKRFKYKMKIRCNLRAIFYVKHLGTTAEKCASFYNETMLWSSEQTKPKECTAH